MENTDSNEKDTTAVRLKVTSPGGPAAAMAARPPLPCPRCDSNNTKFCYFNNYNLNQPRHFCKSCRRYWTVGGSLRNVPLGGGSRKPAKRSRIIATPTTSSSPAASATSSPRSHVTTTQLAPNTAVLANRAQQLLDQDQVWSFGFGSLLNVNPTRSSPFGYSYGSGFDGFGFDGVSGGGFGSQGGSVNVQESAALSGYGCDPWVIGSGRVSVDVGDCYGCPDLSISMPGKDLD